MTLETLSACAGTWQGTSTLQDPHQGIAENSPSKLTVTPVANGKFVRLDYTWTYQDKPQEGSVLIGFDKKTDTVTAHWIDSWHMGNQAMALTGPGGSPVSLRGSYPAPPGPDWGWRIAVTPGEESFGIIMHNLWPEGDREDLAVEAWYTRA